MSESETISNVTENIIGKSRKSALRNGEIYYVGKPCPHGHDGLRYTSSGNCRACSAKISASIDKKEYDKSYAAANKERIAAKSREYSIANRERLNELAIEWVRKNPDRRRAISKAYKSRRRAAEKGGDSTANLLAWEQSAKKVCYWCNCKCDKGYHVDHYEPLSKGGRHEVSNLVIACAKCNLKKSAKDPYLFAQQVGKLF